MRILRIFLSQQLPTSHAVQPIPSTYSAYNWKFGPFDPLPPAPPPPHPLPLVTASLISFSMSLGLGLWFGFVFGFLDSTRKGDHAAFVTLYLAYFIARNVLQVHPRCCKSVLEISGDGGVTARVSLTPPNYTRQNG